VEIATSLSTIYNLSTVFTFVIYTIYTIRRNMEFCTIIIIVVPVVAIRYIVRKERSNFQKFHDDVHLILHILLRFNSFIAGM